MGYNRYRKRSYNISKTKSREYASSMENLRETFDGKGFEDWDLSTMMDSCYARFPKYDVRLSNHSANNQYHDLNSGRLLVNIKTSKLNFVNYIQNNLDMVLFFINQLDLEKYRFINIVDDRITCYYKNYKTKKDVYSIRYNKLTKLEN